MRIERVEAKGLINLPDSAWDFPPEGAYITGDNGAGKSSLLGLISLLLGQTSQALGSLMRPGEEACEASLLLVDGEKRYRFHNRSTPSTNKLSTTVMSEGAWVELPPSPAEARRRIFAQGSDPEILLKDQSDAKVVELLLGVVPSVPYDQAAMLKELGVDVHLEPLRKGGHVLDFLQAVEEQLAAQRTGIGRALHAAEAVVEREARSLPAVPVAPVQAQLEYARAEAEALRLRRDTLKSTTADMKASMCRDADVRFERAVAEAEAERQEARREANEYEARELDELPDLERAIGSAEQAARDAQAAHDRHTADTARREGLAAAKLDAQGQQERLTHVQGLIARVRAAAARLVGDAIPGVRVGVDEKEHRFVEVECDGEQWICEGCGANFETKMFSHARPEHGQNCAVDNHANCPIPVECGPISQVGGENWAPWGVANKARRMEVAAAWSKLRQAQGTAGPVTEAIILLDEAEAFTASTLKGLLSKGGQIVLTRPADGPLRVEAL